MKKSKSPCDLEDSTSDATFQYIAGHTAGGVSFGINWEETKSIEKGTKLQSSQQHEIHSSGNPINLAELAEAFDIQSDSLFFYINQKFGDIVSLTEEEIEAVEEDEDSEFCEARDILDSGDYIAIPSKWDLNAYEIMENFVFSLENVEVQDVLLQAIKGKGAFGRFHVAIQIYKIEDQWHQYRHNRLKEKAIEWCNHYGLDYN